jgi:hypothetical protein
LDSGLDSVFLESDDELDESFDVEDEPSPEDFSSRARFRVP